MKEERPAARLAGWDHRPFLCTDSFSHNSRHLLQTPNLIIRLWRPCFQRLPPPVQPRNPHLRPPGPHNIVLLGVPHVERLLRLAAHQVQRLLKNFRLRLVTPGRFRTHHHRKPQPVPFQCRLQVVRIRVRHDPGRVAFQTLQRGPHIGIRPAPAEPFEKRIHISVRFRVDLKRFERPLQAPPVRHPKREKIPVPNHGEKVSVPDVQESLRIHLQPLFPHDPGARGHQFPHCILKQRPVPVKQHRLNPHSPNLSSTESSAANPSTSRACAISR